MLTSRQVERIKELAKTGYSQRQISRERARTQTVRSVLKNEPRSDLLLCDTLYEVDNPVFTGPPRRCPTCGALAWQPCLACA